MDRPEASEQGFVRGLGLGSATAIVAGALIGSGIFIVSQDIASTLGAPGWLLAVWVATMLITVMGTLCYGELSAMYPRAGGQYVFLREAYGPFWGYLYGWTLFLVIQSGTIAALGVAFGKYLGVLAPWISSSNWLWRVASFDLLGKEITVGLSTAQLAGILAILALTLNNVVGLNAGRLVQNVLTFAKVLALGAVVVVGFCLGMPDGALRQPGFFEAHDASGAALAGWPLFVAFWSAMVGSMFAADAWNNVTFVAAEVRSPQRNVPLALVAGAGGVTLLYVLANVGYLNVLTFDGLADAPDQRVAAAMMARLVPWGAVAIALVVVVSTFGCLNGIVLAGPRAYFAMANDGLFFKAAGRLSARGRVPAGGLWLQAAWACLLTLSGTYSNLLDYVIFACLLFYVLTVAGLFVLRRKAPDLPRPYRVIGYPWLPAAYVLLTAMMMVVLLLYKPAYTWPGLGLVGLGIPVYFVWKRRAG
jgi:APA family basic amino acid/polyamine antiporter